MDNPLGNSHALPVLLTRGVITARTHRHALGLLIRVTQMLTKLAQRMQR